MLLVFFFVFFFVVCFYSFFFFFSSRRRHTRWNCDWSSDVCSSDLGAPIASCGSRPGGGGGRSRSSEITGLPSYSSTRSTICGVVSVSPLSGTTLLFSTATTGSGAVASFFQIGRASCRERVDDSVVG